MWNEPKQERSRKRFSHILDTAAALFIEQGVDAVTTNHIAEHAGVAIGSLYQFFPNKEAVLAALIQRFSVDLTHVFPKEHVSGRLFEQVVGQMVDDLMQFSLRNQAFGSMLAALDTPSHRDLMQPMQDKIVQSIALMLSLYHPQMSDEQCNRCAIVGYGVVKGLIGLDDLPVEVMRAEIKTVLTSYVAAFLKREGLD